MRTVTPGTWVSWSSLPTRTCREPLTGWTTPSSWVAELSWLTIITGHGPVRDAAEAAAGRGPGPVGVTPTPPRGPGLVHAGGQDPGLDPDLLPVLLPAKILNYPADPDPNLVPDRRIPSDLAPGPRVLPRSSLSRGQDPGPILSLPFPRRTKWRSRTALSIRMARGITQNPSPVRSPAPNPGRVRLNGAQMPAAPLQKSYAHLPVLGLVQLQGPGLALRAKEETMETDHRAPAPGPEVVHYQRRGTVTITVTISVWDKTSYFSCAH